jgi:Pentapeptide repeats (8 copies)
MQLSTDHQSPHFREAELAGGLGRLWHNCNMPDLEVMPTGQPMTAAVPESKLRWWSYRSPWWWGLVVLLMIAVPQVLLTSPTFSAQAPNPGAAYRLTPLAGRDLIGADLRGVRLAYRDLRGTDFQRANASGADFSYADLRGADLRDTCLRGANLIGAVLVGADFTGADVAGVTVTPKAVKEAIGWPPISSPSVCSAR